MTHPCLKALLPRKINRLEGSPTTLSKAVSKHHMSPWVGISYVLLGYS